MYGPGYDGSMGSLPWIGAGRLRRRGVGGATIAGVRGLATYRVLRSFQRQLDTAVAETTRLIDGIEPRVAKATASAGGSRRLARGWRSRLASAKVLFAAFGEALALVRRVSAFVPR